jgi:hypothetical protein
MTSPIRERAGAAGEVGRRQHFLSCFDPGEELAGLDVERVRDPGDRAQPGVAVAALE